MLSNMYPRSLHSHCNIYPVVYDKGNMVFIRNLFHGNSLTEAVEQAILGGCTMIQLREKELSSLEFYNQAVAVKQVTDKVYNQSSFCTCLFFR